MKRFSCIFILIFFLALSKAKPIHVVNKQITPKIALAKIKALPEVKSFMRCTKRNKPMLMIQKEPDSTDKYYRIALGVSNVGMFRTSDLYFIDSKTGEIFIDDAMNVSNDDPWHLVSLQQLRRWAKTIGWNKPHIFKNGRLIVMKNSIVKIN